MADSLLAASTPGGEFLETGGVTVALGFMPQVPGTITHYRVWVTTPVPTSVRCRLWRTTGAAAGTVLDGPVDRLAAALTPGWNEIPLSAPVVLAAGVGYKATVFTERYGATVSVLDDGPITSPGGYLVAYADGSNPLGFGALPNGSFAVPPDGAYPTTGGAGALYFVDVLFEPSNDGTLAITLPPIGVALSADARTDGVLAVALPPLASAVTADAQTDATLAVTLAPTLVSLTGPPNTAIPDPVPVTGGTGTEAFLCKAALFDRLIAMSATPLPLAGVQVSYDWPGRTAMRECVYGGGVRFTRASAGHDGHSELWLETATIGLYVRVQLPGYQVRDTDARASGIGRIIETLLQSQPRLAGGYTFVAITGGSGDYGADDNGPITVLAYQVQFQYYLD